MIVVNKFISMFLKIFYMSQPYFGQMWAWSPTLGKSEDLESFGTPECLELDNKAQNTSHWGVLGVIGKVLKRRYMSLDRSRRGLQVWFRPCCDQTLQSGVMSSQNPGTPPGTVSGLQPGSPGKKWHSGVGAAESHIVYYRE